jgi:quercetin dioxygenase-like cupin family protein
MSPSPIVLPGPPAEGLRVIGESVAVLADVERTGSYEIFLQSGPLGAGPPPHTHPWDEAYYVISGTVEVLIGERRIEAQPGTFVHVPAGTVHAYKNVSERASFLSIASKGGAARFFMELDREAPEFPPQLEKVVPIALRNQVMPAGGPPVP